MTNDSSLHSATGAAGRADGGEPGAGREGSRVRVRMYGQGVGDCFLLTFPRSPAEGSGEGAGRPVYVLIDCGVIGGTPGGAERMRRIVRDIKETTRDETLPDGRDGSRGRLDLLVVTHEHMDHLSGFLQAADEWRDIQVDRLWLAWTENPDTGGLPESLRRALERQRKALGLAADRARELGLGERHSTLLSLMSFLVDADGGQPFAAAPGVEDAMKAARALAPLEGTRYCEPGEVLQVPGTGARAYVLGPPRSDRWLTMTEPRSRDRETYEHHLAGREGGGVEARGSRRGGGGSDGDAPPDRDGSPSLRRTVEGPSRLNAFATPLLRTAPAAAGGDAAEGRAGPGLDPVEEDLYLRSFPFEAQLRVPMPEAERAAAQEAESYPALASYFDEMSSWRRIDHDWLGVADEFALRVDNLTNNTALVLAIELPASTEGAERKVLLFVADAQVGNWMSWDDIESWRPADGVDPELGRKRADLTELLGRTVFYKVGHHGSHNATLKARGVERMGRAGELTSFVPVSTPVAREIKGWSKMPLSGLLQALAQRGSGRVVLPNEDDWPADAGKEVARQVKQARAGMTDLRISEARLDPKRRPRESRDTEGPVPLYVELAVEC
jgi:hypothetical protein